MTIAREAETALRSAYQPKEGGSSPTSALQVRPVAVQLARDFIALHHSRLPYTQKGPWKFAFGLFDGDRLCGAALWHNCSARGLPQDWLELRRMAVANAPPNAASKMLGVMRRILFRTTSARRLVSYQDVSVHTGTIYRAAGWTPTAIARPRRRDRTPLRTGTTRRYRSDSNGGAAAAAKVRWEVTRGEKLASLTREQIQAATLMRETK